MEVERARLNEFLRSKRRKPAAVEDSKPRRQQAPIFTERSTFYGNEGK